MAVESIMILIGVSVAAFMIGKIITEFVMLKKIQQIETSYLSSYIDLTKFLNSILDQDQKNKLEAYIQKTKADIINHMIK